MLCSHDRVIAVAVLMASTALSSATCSRAFAGEAAPQSVGAINEVVVTASPVGISRFDVVQGTSILSGDLLADALRGSIGETLADQPGMSSTFFGPFASRPVIRGFDGDRIRVMFDGIGSIDASSVSPDHETAGEASGADRIEILRGPATLMYGTSAIGGVVNIIDGRIPTALPEGGLEANVTSGYGTNAREGFVNGGTDVALGGGFVAHGEGAWRKSQDYRVPGYASAEAEEEGILGRVENSGGRTAQGAGGLSYLWDSGLLGMSVGRFESNYGSPAGHAHAHDEEHEDDHDHDDDHDQLHEDVRIDLKQTRVDGKGELRNLDGFVTAAKFRFAWGDYTHTELEGGTPATVFANKGWEGRLEAVHAALGPVTGVFGVQYRSRAFSAIGEEAFVPNTHTHQTGLFLVETSEFGPWRIEAGGRVEFTRVKSTAAVMQRSFTSAAFSGSMSYELIKDTMAGLIVSWTQRPPTAEELFSNGPHLATNQFEIGDPSLRQEKALNAEATLRRRAGAVTGSISVYRTNYDRFIFSRETGEEVDGIPAFQVGESAARFSGVESEIVWQIFRDRHRSLSIDGGVDYVRATNTTAAEPLPRIQPLRYRLGIDGSWSKVSGRIEVQGADGQSRVAPLESSTGAYTLLNARLAFRPSEAYDMRFVLQGRNLTNAAARPHTSFIKEVAPLPGRDVRLYLQARF